MCIFTVSVGHTEFNSQITSAAGVFALEIQSGEKRGIFAFVFMCVSAVAQHRAIPRQGIIRTEILIWFCPSKQFVRNQIN